MSLELFTPDWIDTLASYIGLGISVIGIGLGGLGVQLSTIPYSKAIDTALGKTFPNLGDSLLDNAISDLGRQGVEEVFDQALAEALTPSGLGALGEVLATDVAPIIVAGAAAFQVGEMIGDSPVGDAIYNSITGSGTSASSQAQEISNTIGAINQTSVPPTNPAVLNQAQNIANNIGDINQK